MNKSLTRLVRTLGMAMILTALLGLGIAGANEDSTSVGVGVTLIGQGTETPTPTVTPTLTPTAPPATKTPNKPSDGGSGTVTKLPSTGGSASTADAVTPALLLVSGGALLAVGWKAHRQAT